MPAPPEPTTPEEHAAMNDFRATLWNPFQTFYEDKWDQGNSGFPYLRQRVLMSLPQ